MYFLAILIKISILEDLKDNILHSTNEKNLVWHSHNFLLFCNATEENFITSTTFKLKFYNVCFAVE